MPADPDAPPRKRRTPTKVFHWGVVWSVFTGVGTLVGAAAIFFLAAEWLRARVDESVQQRLTDERTIRQIAALVRPSLVVDSNGSILADFGASQLIREITFSHDEGGLPKSMTLDLAKPIPFEPFVTTIDPDSVATFAKRSKGAAWTIELRYDVIALDNKAVRRFRVEVAP